VLGRSREASRERGEGMKTKSGGELKARSSRINEPGFLETGPERERGQGENDKVFTTSIYKVMNIS